MSFVPRVPVLLLLASVVLGVGCARFQRGAGKAESSPLEMRIALTPVHGTAKGDASPTSSTVPVFRPGEMVVCAVEVTSRWDRGVTLLQPWAAEKRIDANIQFMVREKDRPEILRRVPILIKGGAVPRAAALAPGASLQERFGFANLTRRAGTYYLEAEYTAAAFPAGSYRNRVFSSPVAFQVAGPRAWKRDADDILLKEEAIRVARERYGKAVRGAEARLIENEAGILDWWVTLEKQSADTPPGASPRVAYLVSPYGAFVRKAAKPFPLSGKAEAPPAAAPAATPTPVPSASPTATGAQNQP